LEYLEHNDLQQDFWHVDRYYDEMKCGDIVFVWKSKDSPKLDNRGIYAKAKILTEPKSFFVYELEHVLEHDKTAIDKFEGMERIQKKYWVDLEKKGKVYQNPLIWVEYTKFLLDKPLLLAHAQVKSILSGSTITGPVPRHVVHKLDQRQGRALEQIMDSI